MNLVSYEFKQVIPLKVYLYFLPHPILDMVLYGLYGSVLGDPSTTAACNMIEWSKEGSFILMSMNSIYPTTPLMTTHRSNVLYL